MATAAPILYQRTWEARDGKEACDGRYPMKTRYHRYWFGGYTGIAGMTTAERVGRCQFR